MRSLRVLTIVVIAMVAVDALWQPLILSWAALSPATFTANITPIATGVDGAALLFKISTMVVFGVWIYRAGRNLADAGLDALEFTPASRIWWFAVPFANLVKPYQGMRELWNASRGTWPYDGNDPLIGVWWALWLVNSVLARFVSSADPDEAVSTAWLIVGSSSDIALGVVAIMILRGIEHGQQTATTSHLGDVFA